MQNIILLKRVAAYFFDLLILLILQYSFGELGVSGYILSLLLFFLYRLITTSFMGATAGMKIFKIKLKKYNFKICFKREIYRFACEFYYMGYIYATFDPYKRGVHDIMADTYIEMDKNVESLKRDSWIKYIGYILLIVSVLKWTSNFILNDVGLLGLKKIASSDEYFQSFEGDNIVSMSQEELFMKTMGRKYTALIEINGERNLVRISNKQRFTDVYKLIMENGGLRGEYLYRVPYPLQFICSGNFKAKRDLCGLSPKGDLIVTNEIGKIYARGKSNIESPVTLRCGDLDGDGKDEMVVMGSSGDAEVFKMEGNELKEVFSGKFGEDIIPETFYIKDGINIFGSSSKGDILYNYKFKNNRFIFSSKRYTKIKGVSNVFDTDYGILVSNVFRNEMMLKRGKIQRLEVYTTCQVPGTWHVKRELEFGNRPGRRYDYAVRTIEDVEDIDGDGTAEVVIKSVGKDDVMGQRYIVEVYTYNKFFLKLNRFFTLVPGT